MLAEKGKGFVNPNPLVGAIIVKEGRIIGEGWHERYGGLHAERNAFAACREDVCGATMYVTLEPCCHYGKTPPCTDAIIEHGIARVVIGLPDPNPLVAGKGIERLRAAGIEVEIGVAATVLSEQNRVFLKYITTKMPWVVMKTAMTLDGKIATYSGDSKWVTGEEARNRVQRMRSEYMAIMVGAGTVGTDDPILNCRYPGTVRQPVRIVVASRAKVRPDSRIVKTAKEYRTIIAHTSQAGREDLEELQAAGIEVLLCRERDGRVDIGDMLRELGGKGIDSVLLEGGGELNYAFISGGFVDEVYAFIAPKIAGGKDAKTPVEGEGIERMNDAVVLMGLQVEKVGEDIMVNGKVGMRGEIGKTG